jgi:hypothetical protein
LFAKKNPNTPHQRPRGRELIAAECHRRQAKEGDRHHRSCRRRPLRRIAFELCLGARREGVGSARAFPRHGHLWTTDDFSPNFIHHLDLTLIQVLSCAGTGACYRVVSGEFPRLFVTASAPLKQISSELRLQRRTAYRRRPLCAHCG